MQLKRVVITGMGAVSPLGAGVSSLMQGIVECRSAVRSMPGWETYRGLRSLVAAPAPLVNEKDIPRQARRSMGPMSIFSVQAGQEALRDSGFDAVQLASGRVGCVIGSTMGGATSINDVFELMIPKKDLTLLTSMKFFQCVSHTAALNVAQFFGIKGVVMATSAACASGLQAVGAAYDLIRLGRQDAVLCGGAEELHPTVTGSFDVLFATSTGFNQSPSETPRPFDAKRDGLVCGEGAAVMLAEEYEHARARKARIYGEITGYHTCSSGLHISQSSREALAACMKSALESAGVLPAEIDYINAHATATLQGDKEEAEAVRDVFGDTVPVSSLKGYFGHTLGASGALELIAALMMMKEGVLYP
ncbi:MAG: beta-ketoacyl-[acyl-carrier-protein] synthase family protein, partial [Candidatus Omnitrophica bacterium]|nr:beta-ketoacyl-[acyl-carrier-protein] synthase family protein [Candidatus Omnitrophota bacterium]